jgi:hypothetical protein
MILVPWDQAENNFRFSSEPWPIALRFFLVLRQVKIVG